MITQNPPPIRSHTAAPITGPSACPSWNELNMLPM
jgi:hypothetical protein